jgi:hypothetical protein
MFPRLNTLQDPNSELTKEGNMSSSSTAIPEDEAALKPTLLS